MNPGYATLEPMSTTGTSSPATAMHLVARADAGHEPRFDEERLRDGRIVHRHDPADDDEVTSPRSRRRRRWLSVPEHLSAEQDGDVGELVPAKAQPVTRPSTDQCRQR